MCLLSVCVKPYPVGHRDSLLTGGLIAVVVTLSHPPPLQKNHTYTQLLHCCCWRHCEGLPAFINAASFQRRSSTLQSSDMATTHHSALMMTPYTHTQTLRNTHTHYPPTATAHIWQGRMQFVTPRWPQSGRFLHSSTCFYFSALSPSLSLPASQADFTFHLGSNGYELFTACISVFLLEGANSWYL